MVSAPAVAFCAALFALLGYGWVRGYDIVKAKAPGQLAKFYLAYAVFRVVTILLVVAVYVFAVSGSQQQSKAFAVMVLLMYAAMMALTLKIRH